MPTIPETGVFDSSVAFLREGYGFVCTRCRRLGSDIIRTRIMLTPAWFIQGAEAAGVFHAPGRFTRRKARSFLDIWGTNRDPRTWDAPETFRPERFRDRDGSAYDSRSGGEPYLDGHRCPGEWITIALMKRAVRFLAGEIRYSVPDQDLGVDLSRIPARPASRFRMADVRRASGG